MSPAMYSYHWHHLSTGKSGISQIKNMRSAQEFQDTLERWNRQGQGMWEYTVN